MNKTAMEKKLKKLNVIQKFLKAKLDGELLNILVNHNQTMINEVEKLEEKRIDVYFDNLVDNLLHDNENRNYWKLRYYTP